MTQPVSPGIVFNERGPVEFNTLEGSRGAANPLAPPPQVTLPGDAPAEDFAPVRSLGIAPEKYDPDQADLEARHSKSETFANQFARGALSALLAPGSLLGMTAETIGKAADAFQMGIVPDELEGRIGSNYRPGKWLEDFGRDLGQASTGRSALEAAQYLAAEVSGEDDATGIADQARIAIDEQERAWPLLSTGAQAAGALAFGVGTGGLAKGGADLGLKGLMAVGAVEGAAAGAQAAYDVDAPLSEVWASAGLGSLFGAGTGAAVGGVQAGVQKLRGGKLADAFGGEGSMLGEIAEQRAAKAVGLRGPEFRRLGEKRAVQVGKDVLDYHYADGTPVLPNRVLDAIGTDQAELTERLARAVAEQGDKLGTFRKGLSDFIDESAPELRPSTARLAERFESEILTPIASSASPGAKRQAVEARRYLRNLTTQMGDDMSLEDLFRQRLDVDKFDVNFNSKAPDVMKDVRRIMEEHVEETIHVAAQRAGLTNDYGEMKRVFGSLKEASQASAKASGTDLGNRWLSLSDNMVGMATIAGDLASGGGLSVIKGAGAGLAHKVLREQGSLVTATLLNRFRRTAAPVVDVAKAAGREAQDAVSAIMRAKAFIQNTAEAAGANPSVRAVAQNTAEDVAAEELARIAGKFEPERLFERAPSPLARVLYRPQILDTVSERLAPTVERSLAMRPSLDFDIDPGKLTRLTKNAEGPEAIGLVQQRIREIADNYTTMGQGIDEALAQPSADQVVANRVLPVLEKLLDRLDTATVPDAMATAHDVARVLQRNGATAHAQSLMGTLGDGAFGDAGKLYRQMTAPPSDGLRDLADPAKLRQTLRTLELRGGLSEQVAAEHRATLAAYEARKRLTGEAVPSDVKRSMAAIENMWARGEESVTLDGTRLGRIVDILNKEPDATTVARVPAVPPEQQVQQMVKENIQPVKDALTRKPRSGRAAYAAAAASFLGAATLTAKERQGKYEEALDKLTREVVQPNTAHTAAAVTSAPPAVRDAMTLGMNQKLTTLQRDLPKPASSIHGLSYESLSSDDIRRGFAMMEATFDPMSVFTDFANGDVDPDKVAYAWKQYPGLQRMAQLGTIDILQSQLTDKQRTALPDTVLTQVDFLLGFNGTLAQTVNFEFSQRMTQVGEAQKQQAATPSPPNKGLSLPTSKPTMTQRIAGAN